MKMRSMALSKKEAKESRPVATSDSNGPRYPYGLEIRLDNESLTKLGMSLPKVGEYVKIRAEACVTSVSENESKGGKAQRSVSLQIERLAVDDEPQTMEEAVDKGVREA